MKIHCDECAVELVEVRCLAEVDETVRRRGWTTFKINSGLIYVCPSCIETRQGSE